MSAGQLDVFFSPAAAWRRESGRPPSRHWPARPMLLLVVMGCAVSLIAAGSVTLRLVLPAMLSASFVPLLQIASLAAVLRGSMPLRRAVDLFLVGNAPWLVLLLAFAAAWGFLPAPLVFRYFIIGRTAAGLLFLWSLYIDWQFFRIVFGRRPVAAARDLAVQRALCWGPGVAIFVAPSASQVVAGWLRL